MKQQFAAILVGLGFLCLMGAGFATLSVGANIDALHEYSREMLRSATTGTTLHPFQVRYLGTGWFALFAPVVLAALGTGLVISGFLGLSPDEDDD